MANLATLLASVFIGLIALFIGKKSKKTKAIVDPPKNPAADAAKAQEHEQLQENLKKIEESLESENPADSLADLGNARKR
jgi:hypothetical protein